jgi:enoyl-CoA hydratase
MQVLYQLPDEIAVSELGSVRIVTLNRPAHRNAVNHGMHNGLANVWAQLSQDEEARVVILTGAGTAFCAGGEYDFIRQSVVDPDHRQHTMRDARRIVTEMMSFPLPIIAAVNGPAVGFGCSLALLSDIVLISESTYLADPHVSLGVVAADGGALIWPLLTSMLKAKEFLLTGDRIPAQVAVQLGLANRAVDAASLMQDAEALALRLAGQPRQALQDTKRVLNLHVRHAVNNVMDFAFSAESETLAAPGLLDHIATVIAQRQTARTVVEANPHSGANASRQAPVALNSKQQ